MRKLGHKVLILLMVLLAGLGCGYSRDKPDLTSRKDFARLKGLCLESTKNLFVKETEDGSSIVRPTDEEPGSRGPGAWIEPAGSRIVLGDFEARNSFDGIDYFSYGTLTTSTGKQVRIMSLRLIDGQWFRKAVRAAANKQPPTDFSLERPPLDFRYVKLCVPSRVSTDESGPKEGE